MAGAPAVVPAWRAGLPDCRWKSEFADTNCGLGLMLPLTPAKPAWAVIEVVTWLELTPKKSNGVLFHKIVLSTVTPETVLFVPPWRLLLTSIAPPQLLQPV